jgi:hypothetical protein
MPSHEFARRNRATGRTTFVEQLESRQLLSSVVTTSTRVRPSSGFLGMQLARKVTASGPLNDEVFARSPGLSSTIEGITYDENATNNFGTAFIPPDPMGAAGPTQVVSVVNASIEFHSKDGTQNESRSLGNFFLPLAPIGRPFDTKVIYDTYNQRFVVVAAEQTDTATGGAANTSRILIAVSDDSNPSGTWRYHAINSRLIINGAQRWADFPGLGVDANAIYITANMFSFGATNIFNGSRLWIVNKTPFYNVPGPNAATFTLHDPSTLASLPAQAASLVPAVMYGANTPANMGTFLLASNFSSGQNEAVAVLRITNPLAGPTFSNGFVLPGDIDNQSVAFPNAPQSGGATPIDAGLQQILSAVWRNNKLYAVTTVNPPSGANAGQATAHWFVINADGVLAPTLADQGNIGGEDLGAGTHTFYPSIAADDNGNFAIGFSASNAGIFPGAYYTIHASTDAAGTVQSSGTLALGMDSYVRTFGGADNRWGDYTGTSVDPADGSFWFFNQYADMRGSPSSPPLEDGRWRTRWGHLPLPSIAAPGVPDLVAASDTGVSLTDNITRITLPTFTGTAITGNTVILRANGVAIGSGPVVGGTYTITATVPLAPDGMYNITAEQTDLTNTSFPSAPLSVTVDTLAPTITSPGGQPVFNFLIALHSLSYAFSENVGIFAGALTVVQQPATTLTTNLGYNSTTFVASFTFPGFPNGTLPDAEFNATLAAANVTDVAGNHSPPTTTPAFSSCAATRTATAR